MYVFMFMLVKTCSSCKIEQTIMNFHKYKKSKDGHTHRCKSCVSRKTTISSENKKCTSCEIIKSIGDFNKRSDGKLGRNSVCKLCYQDKQTKWRFNNEERYLEYRRNYYMNRRTSDDAFKITSNLRCRLYQFLKSKKMSKNNSTFEIIGCTPEYLRIYIENKFTDNMSWDNYGYDGWHLDHIIPLSRVNTIDDIYKLFHYTNLQPLWGKENMKKSDKYEN